MSEDRAADAEADGDVREGDRGDEIKALRKTIGTVASKLSAGKPLSTRLEEPETE